MSGSRAIRVIARERPANGSEGILDPPSLMLDEESNSAESFSAETGKAAKIRTDGCFGPERTQEDIWYGVSSVLDEVRAGRNSTIFAYGVTGSGKTHTMQGTVEGPGLIYRTIESIFAFPDLDKVQMSLVEILNDQVYDLMSGMHNKLDIRSDGYKNYIPHMMVEKVDSVEHFDDLFSFIEAAGQRATASTRLNAQSSRSHSILMLDLEMTELETGMPIRAKLRLIDLAGSENNNRTGNDRERLRESAAINQSLTSLGNVIDAINTGRKPVYRESKLTRILEDVLGGESRGVMICCLAPGSKFAKDTYNTLCFAQRASGLKARSVTHQPRVSAVTRPSTTMGAPSRPRQSVKVFQEPTVPVRPIARAPLRAMQNGVVPPTKTANYVSKADVEKMLEPILQQNAQLVPRVVQLETANAEMAKRLEQSQAQSVQPTLTDEESAWWAKICVREARAAQESGDYPKAATLYRKALVHRPDAERIQARIAEIGLIMDGTLPRPAVAPVKRLREGDLATAMEIESPLKRTRIAE